MDDPVKPPASSGMSATRLKDRLLHPWSRVKEEGRSSLPAIAPERPMGFPSRIAEFLLVFRLRASRRSALPGDMMERALRVVLVTCRNWFAGDSSHPPRQRKHD